MVCGVELHIWAVQLQYFRRRKSFKSHKSFEINYKPWFYQRNSRDVFRHLRRFNSLSNDCQPCWSKWHFGFLIGSNRGPIWVCKNKQQQQQQQMPLFIDLDILISRPPNVDTLLFLTDETCFCTSSIHFRPHLTTQKRIDVVGGSWKITSAHICLHLSRKWTSQTRTETIETRLRWRSAFSRWAKIGCHGLLWNRAFKYLSVFYTCLLKFTVIFFSGFGASGCILNHFDNYFLVFQFRDSWCMNILHAWTWGLDDGSWWIGTRDLSFWGSPQEMSKHQFEAAWCASNFQDPKNLRRVSIAAVTAVIGHEPDLPVVRQASPKILKGCQAKCQSCCAQETQDGQGVCSMVLDLTCSEPNSQPMQLWFFSHLSSTDLFRSL